MKSQIGLEVDVTIMGEFPLNEKPKHFLTIRTDDENLCNFLENRAQHYGLKENFSFNKLITIINEAKMITGVIYEIVSHSIRKAPTSTTKNKYMINNYYTFVLNREDI
jgi:hypothetical protein